jgi:hypothetical protein
MRKITKNINQDSRSPRPRFEPGIPRIRSRSANHDVRLNRLRKDGIISGVFKIVLKIILFNPPFSSANIVRVRWDARSWVHWIVLHQPCISHKAYHVYFENNVTPEWQAGRREGVAHRMRTLSSKGREGSETTTTLSSPYTNPQSSLQSAWHLFWENWVQAQVAFYTTAENRQ